jgi:phosphoglycolate phosphatase
VPLPKDTKAVLFDFDQTLIHLGANWDDLRKALAAIAQRYGVAFNEQMVLRGIGQAFKQLADEGRVHEAASFRTEAFERVEDEENRALENSHAIARAPELVAEVFQRGYKVAIVSNNNPNSISEALRRFGFPPIEHIIGRHNGQPVKPSPIPVQKALARLHLKPQEAILIGDSEADLASGKAAGVATILFCQPGAAKEVQTKPTERIEDLWKLLDFLPYRGAAPGNGVAPAFANTRAGVPARD